MEIHSYKGEAALLLTAFIWGSGFIGVNYALQCGFPPGLLNMTRFLVGAAALLLIINRKMKHITMAEIKTGVIAGGFYFLGFLFQTLGLQTIEVSSNALLTATNLLMVPFIARLVFKEKIHLRVYIAVVACFFGISALNWSNGGIHFSGGDLLTLAGALAFACHICYLGNATDGKNTFHLTFLQLLTVGVLSSFYFLAFETNQTATVQWGHGLLALVYLGLFPSALCLFLQTFGQRRTPTAKSAILLSFESIFGAAFSVFLDLEPFTMKLLIGGSIVFLSVIWLEWSNSRNQKNGELST